MWLKIQRISKTSDALLLVIGRALAIAQNYERNARFVLQIAQMGKEYVEGREETLAELIEFANSLPRRMLGSLVRGFDQLGDVTGDEIEILRRGTEARNFIAHEAAEGLAYNRASDRSAFYRKLEAAVRDLVEADNLISCWSYEIQEKAAAPARIRNSYPAEAHRWVMEPLLSPDEESGNDV